MKAKIDKVKLGFNFFSRKTKSLKIHIRYEKLTFYNPDQESLSVVFRDNSGETFYHYIERTNEFSIEVGHLRYNSFYIERKGWGKSAEIKIEISISVL
jgi:hypothetical protein